MKKLIEFRWFGMIGLILMLPACEKETNDDVNQDPHTKFRPVEIVNKKNGEPWQRFVYTYDGEKLSTILEYWYEFDVEEEDTKTFFYYPNENTILREDFLLPVDAGEMPDDKTIYMFDGGKLIETIDSFYVPQIFAPGFYLPGSREVYTYSGDLVVERTSYWDEDGIWVITLKEILEYDGNNVIKIETFDKNREGSLESRVKYEMDYTDDLLSQVILYYRLEPYLKRIPEYEGNQMISAIVYEWRSGAWTPYYDMEFTNDADGNCIEETETYYDTGDEYKEEITFERGESNYYKLMYPTGRISRLY